MLYDLIIVGAGPAGITASVYAARQKLIFLVLAKDIGGQAILSADIENYTGYQLITGPELALKFKEHMDQFKVEINEGTTVTSIKKENDIFKVETDKEHFSAKTVIIASGRIPRKLNVQGEDEFKNKGVTYCATCDAPLFANKDVAVIGGGNSALDATLQLLKIADKIHIITIEPQLRADSIMVEKAKNSQKVIVYTDSTVKEIYGDNFLKGIRIEKGSELLDISVQGIFIEIGSMPAGDFIKDIEKNKHQEIIVDCECKTNIPGLFAAGDVTNVFAKQIIIACGEGAKSAISAFEYLSKR